MVPTRIRGLGPLKESNENTSTKKETDILPLNAKELDVAMATLGILLQSQDGGIGLQIERKSCRRRWFPSSRRECDRNEILP